MSGDAVVRRMEEELMERVEDGEVGGGEWGVNEGSKEMELIGEK